VAGLGDALDARWEYEPYAAFIRRLASFSRLIMLDRRGIGASDPISLEALPSWEEWGNDALVVLDAVGSERAALFGANDSASTALLFAATRPQRTHSLILFNGSARQGRADDYPWGLPIADLEGLFTLLEETWGTEESAALGVPDRADDAEFLRWVAKNQRISCSPREAGVYLRQILNYDVRSVLPLVRVPTLVLYRKDNPSCRSTRFATWSSTSPEPSSRWWQGPASCRTSRPPRSSNTSRRSSRERPRPPTPRGSWPPYCSPTSWAEQAAALGDRRWKGLLESHDAVSNTVLEQHDGRLVKLTGDGVLATFDGPGRAIRCATALRDSLEPLGIRIRAGLHTGEVELRADDIGGIAVHIAARVLEQAGAGELLTSSAVPLLVAGSGIDFEDRGEHELKGVPGAWRLFAVRD
jgi:pimeloyl-ACP methyl ester carboxylesterase